MGQIDMHFLGGRLQVHGGDAPEVFDAQNAPVKLPIFRGYWMDRHAVGVHRPGQAGGMTPASAYSHSKAGIPGFLAPESGYDEGVASAATTIMNCPRTKSLGGKKRILMLSIVNPAVERNGASTVTRGLLKLLKLPPFRAHVELVPVRAEPVRWHQLMQARSLLRSCLSNIPAKAAFCYSREFQEKVVARVKDQCYDAVILNGADLLWILEYLPQSVPRILVAHNIEHQLFGSQIRNFSRLYRPLEPLLRAECKRLEDYELNGMCESGNVIFLSHEEATCAQGLCEGLHITTVPPVFDYEPAIRRPRKAGPMLKIGLLGNFLWWPNRIGLRWFTQTVLPYVKSPLQLSLFGHAAGNSCRSHWRVVKHGMVENLQQVWDDCDFMICPALSTGGVSVKFAEAMYNGTPVLATCRAARGLRLGQDPALVLLDEPGEWIEFLNSAAARQLAERQVQKKTCAQFTTGAQKDTLQQFVKDAISRGAPGSRPRRAIQAQPAGGIPAFTNFRYDTGILHRAHDESAPCPTSNCLK